MCLRNDNFMWNAGFYSCDDSVWRIVQTWRGILFYGAGHHMLYCGVTKVETQNLASPDFNFCILYCSVSKVEMQNLASHKQKVHIYSWYYCCCHVATGCSWDARFCVSTGLRHCYDIMLPMLGTTYYTLLYIIYVVSISPPSRCYTDARYPSLPLFSNTPAFFRHPYDNLSYPSLVHFFNKNIPRPAII